MALAEGCLDSMLETYAPAKADFESWTPRRLKRAADSVFAIDTAPLDFSDRTAAEISDIPRDKIVANCDAKEKLIGPDLACGASNATSCSRSSTGGGRITSIAWTTSRKASGCVVTARRSARQC